MCSGKRRLRRRNDPCLAINLVPCRCRQSRASPAIYSRVSLADAYAIHLPPGTARNPEVLARFVFAHQPRWISLLMRIRGALVTPFGLKTGSGLRSAGAEGSRIGIFKVYEVNAVEVIMGEDDKHLDFRVSALYQAAVASERRRSRFVLSTVVHCHNRLGRCYLGLIAPFHRLIVRSYLRRAARMGLATRGTELHDRARDHAQGHNLAIGASLLLRRHPGWVRRRVTSSPVGRCSSVAREHRSRRWGLDHARCAAGRFCR
jgi:hypothetical protein